MKKISGKSNIDILKDYVSGVRPFVQVGFTGEKNKYRKDGDKWKDKDGVEWERKNGSNVRLTKTQGDIIRDLIRQKCKCGQVIAWGSKLDQKLFNRTGLCSECLIKYETGLRILGIYDDYEKYKLVSYELGRLKEGKEKIKDAINFFSQGNNDIQMICNSEGFIERWKTNDHKEILANAKRDLKLVKQRITEITKIRDEAKKLYLAGAKKYKLEVYV